MTTRIILLLLFCTCLSVFRAEEVDIQSMTSHELADLEENLKSEVGQAEKELHSIRHETDRLKQEKSSIDQETERLQGAKNWELIEKKKRQEQLDAAKNDVVSKQESITRMSNQVDILKDQIANLKSRLSSLNLERDSAEKKSSDPTLSDVLESRSQNWSNVTRNVFTKTMADVVPAISDLTETARTYRRRVSRTSKFFELVATLLIYSFLLFSGVAIYRVYGRVRGKITIPRLLFLGDAFCACFWFVMLTCFAILFDDPLYVVKQRSPTPFFVFQLVACFSYVNFVLLHVLVLATKMSLGALGETLGVMIVGHHYYVRVWQPAILDKPFRGTFFYYFCYCWMFCAFAYSRIQEFAPLKQLRGPTLPPLMWFRVLLARFTARGVPMGDIESTPYEDSDDEGHER